MENYTYHFEISTLITQFLDSLNEIKIKRYDRSNSFISPVQKGEDISPTFIYSSKQRVIHDYINNQAQIKLPAIAFSMSSIKRDESRVRNKLTGAEFGGNTIYEYHKIRQPVPVTIDISMSILSKSQEDIDQIITNFIPYSDGYTVVSWESPYYSDQEIRSKIVWSGDVSLTIPTDLKYSDQYRIIADTSFTIEGWLFKADDQFNGVIHNIYTHFHAVSDVYCGFSDNENAIIATETDIISGRPVITNAFPFKVIPNEPGTHITINGSMFDFASGFYISGVTLENQELHDFSNTVLSSVITEISGIEISPTVFSGSIAEFAMPAVTAAGFFDIIAVNEAGVGKLTVDSFNDTIYPTPSASPGEEGWEVYQSPCISGIEILNISAYI